MTSEELTIAGGVIVIESPSRGSDGPDTGRTATVTAGVASPHSDPPVAADAPVGGDAHAEVSLRPPHAVYTLAELPYGFDAFSPILSASAVEAHWHHHGELVAAANARLVEVRSLGTDDDPSHALATLATNVSGHLLHTLFWSSVSPEAGRPSESFEDAININFGSFDGLRAIISNAISHGVGNGWVMLGWEPNARQLLLSQCGENHAAIVGMTPILVIDCWEHAYQADYGFDRAQWGRNVLNIVDWTSVSERYALHAEGVIPLRQPGGL